MSDGSFSWIEIPPRATLVFTWDGRRHDFFAGGCTSTGSCCWAPSAAAAGTYEIRVVYSLDAGTSAARACPGGGVPWELQPYQDVATIARCSRTCAGAGCPALALDAVATATFVWPGTASVRVELGGG
jgi:xanthine/CO dehydrogenase XdhC/CoxF family maturation factor